jgi:hypothetical protein
MAMTQRTCLVVASLLLLASPAFPQLSRDAAIATAEGILRNFQDGKAEDIGSELDARMSKELTADKVQAAWKRRGRPGWGIEGHRRAPGRTSQRSPGG